MKIPFVALDRLPQRLTKNIKKRIARVIGNSDFILGKEVEQFDQEFARYVDTQYAIGVASGTDALLLSLIALGIQPGDEVVVPAMTFIASVSPVVQIGAKPVVVDILPDKPLIDPSLIEKAITKRTRAIIPVHLYGFPCDMDRILSIARRHKLYVIEDACQAHGSTYHEKKMGSFGDIGCFSFYPSKNLGAYGDGGAVVTSSKQTADIIIKLRNHGQVAKYQHEILGYNSRLDTLQAVVLSKKLSYLDRWNKQRHRIARWYNETLKDLPITLLHEDPRTVTNYHIYAIKTSRRDALLNFLKSKHIDCGIHYPTPIHLLKPFSLLGYKKDSFSNAEAFARETISLPMFPQITKDEVDVVTTSIKHFFGYQTATD